MIDSTLSIGVIPSKGQVNAVAKEKGLGAVLIKGAVPQGGVDVTDSVIEKMK